MTTRNVHVNNAQRLIGLFGGVRPMSRATGIDAGAICRFGKAGDFPPSYNDRVLSAAKTEGIQARARIYLTTRCDKCGQRIRD